MAEQASIEQAGIRDLLSRINNAWVHKRGDALTTDLKECFSGDVVFRGPGFVLLGRGCDFAVQSYRDFTAQAEVKDFSLEEPAIDISGETATAHYKWIMTYGLNAQQYTEQGHDLFVLSKATGSWLVVWRVLLPEPV